jgi:predicted ribosome quality control (RQC) complex YloA/Tae2 family protein
MTAALFAAFGYTLLISPVSGAVELSREFAAALESEAYDTKAPALDLSAIAEEEKQRGFVRSGKKPQPLLSNLNLNPAKASTASPSPARPAGKSPETLEISQDLMSIDGELAEADLMAYGEITVDAQKETRRLKEEIASLERKIERDRTRAKSAKQKADDIQRRLELTKRLASDAQKRASETERAKTREERRRDTLKERLMAAEERLIVAKRRTQEATLALNAAKRTNAQLERKLKTQAERIERERKRQKEINQKISQEKNRTHSKSRKTAQL